MYSADDPSREGGCPIRTPRDQNLLAVPPGFSQRATSFIASWCQGIHQMPFSCSKTCKHHPAMETDLSCQTPVVREDLQHRHHNRPAFHAGFHARLDTAVYRPGRTTFRQSRVRHQPGNNNHGQQGTGPAPCGTIPNPRRPARTVTHQNLIHISNISRQTSVISRQTGNQPLTIANSPHGFGSRHAAHPILSGD